MKIGASLALLLLIIAAGTVMLVKTFPEPPAAAPKAAPAIVADSMPLDSCWTEWQRTPRSE